MIFFVPDGRFKIFVIQNYSEILGRYLQEEGKHASKVSMKELLLSTISITLSVVDANNHKWSKNDYFTTFRNTIIKCTYE